MPTQRPLSKSPHLSAFTRQLEKAYRIKSFKGGLLLNSKFEYNHNILPSVVTDDQLSSPIKKPPPQARNKISAPAPAPYPNPSPEDKLETELYVAIKRKILQGQEDKNNEETHGRRKRIKLEGNRDQEKNLKREKRKFEQIEECDTKDENKYSTSSSQI